MQKTKAIVLRTVRYTDNRIIVSLFSEHYGMISTIVHIAHGGKRGGRSALWQLLNIVELNVDFRSSSELQKVGEVQISTSWKDLPYHPFKVSISMFLADFLYHSLRGEGENRALFSFLENSLQWLDESEKGISDFHLLLMIRMTRFLGIWPGTEGCGSGKLYDLKNACYVSQIPPHGQYVEADEASLLPLLLRLDYSTMHLLRMSTNNRRHMLDVLLRYYQLHVPGFGELQSLDVLREIFS